MKLAWKAGMATILLSAVLLSACARSGGPGSLAEATQSLKNDKSIVQYAVSPDSTKIAFLQGSSDSSRAERIGVFSVADSRRRMAGETDLSNPHDITWSADSRYFSVNDGTSTQFAAHIFDASTLKERLRLGNSTGMVWAPTGSSAAFSVVDPDMRLAVPTEPTGTTDVVIYQLSTLRHRTILKGTASYFCRLRKWSPSGLAIQKQYLSDNDNRQETVTLSLAE